MVSSTLSISISTSYPSIFIAECAVISKRTPTCIGNIPQRCNFQELLIVTGTTYPSGIFLNRVCSPLLRKGFGTPVLLRVPSGKITPLLLNFCRYFENFTNSTIACLGLFLSIKMEPPWLRLYEIEGIPFPNSTFEINFGWYFRRYQVIVAISHILWWL